MKRLSIVGSLNFLLGLAFLLSGCGGATSTLGTVTFVPSGVDITTSAVITRTQAVTVIVRDDGGKPLPNTDVFCQTPIQGRPPYAGADIVSFLDEDNSPISIASPAGNNFAGTTISGETGDDGTFDFTFQYPTGEAYMIEIFCFSGRAIGSYTQNIIASSS